MCAPLLFAYDMLIFQGLAWNSSFWKLKEFHTIHAVNNAVANQSVRMTVVNNSVKQVKANIGS